MNHQQLVQYAVLCLQALDQCDVPALTPKEISEIQGLPLGECKRIIYRLQTAGILAFVGGGKVALTRPAGEVTALQLIEAVWDQQPLPYFQMLVGGTHGMRWDTTLTAIERVTAGGVELHD